MLATDEMHECSASERSTGAMQGLGKGPTGIVAGRSDGRLCLVTHYQQSPSVHCLLEAPPYPGSKMECLGVTTRVVVTASNDGALRVARLDTP
jgi:hypothetical protein